MIRPDYNCPRHNVRYVWKDRLPFFKPFTHGYTSRVKVCPICVLKDKFNVGIAFELFRLLVLKKRLSRLPEYPREEITHQ